MFDGPNTYTYTHNNPIIYTDPTGEFVPVLLACASNPVCAAAVQAGIGAAVGGVSALIGAMNDPCASAGQAAQAAVMGALTGAAYTALPVQGVIKSVAVKNGLAGFTGNSIGQMMVGGPQNYSISQATVQGGIGAVSGGYGHALGFAGALNMARSGTAAKAAITAGRGLGTTGAVAMSASLNMMTPTQYGGMNPKGNNCGCNP